MGVGMVAILDPEDADRALAMLTARHLPGWLLGEVERTKDVTADLAQDSRVLLRGEHPRF
jgi:phosphoribosylformylglycinamidine cyclo-ligase